MPLVVAALGLLLASISGQPPEAQAPAAARIREVIGLINAGDVGAARDYFRATAAGELAKRGPEEAAADAIDVRGQTGGLELASIVPNPPMWPDRIMGLSRGRLTEGYFAVLATVDDQGRLTALDYSPAGPPSGAPEPAPVAPEDLPRVIDEYTTRLADANLFSGVVLLARDGEVLFHKAYGVADRNWEIPCRPDTKFNIASMGKMFTAVAVAQLAEQGKLSFEDTVAKHLGAEWLPTEITERVRIKHLLSHTSGLGNYLNDDFFKTSRDLYRKIDDYKPAVRGEKLEFEPGARWSYSNTGYLLLGAIIEKASGQDYFEYVRGHIFRPAGMTGTDSYELDRPVHDLAVGYSVRFTPDGPQWRNNVFRHVMRGASAGGGFSTAPDLLRFDRALRGGTLVSMAALEQLWSPQSESRGGGKYGYGFQLFSIDAGNRVVGHGGGGGDMGISSDLFTGLDSGYTLVILSNTSDGGTWVRQKVLPLLPRKP
jgi:CubicO group peptidase (beta-lactamase class C family)